jgi:hypothetical protein
MDWWAVIDDLAEYEHISKAPFGTANTSPCAFGIELGQRYGLGMQFGIKYRR